MAYFVEMLIAINYEKKNQNRFESDCQLHFTSEVHESFVFVQECNVGKKRTSRPTSHDSVS